MNNIKTVEENFREFFGRCRLRVHGANKNEICWQVNSVRTQGSFSFFQHLQQRVLNLFRTTVDFVKEQNSIIRLENFSWRECLDACGTELQRLDRGNVPKQIFNSKVWTSLHSYEPLFATHFDRFLLLGLALRAQWRLRIAMIRTIIQRKRRKKPRDILCKRGLSNTWRSKNNDVTVHQ